MLHWRMRKTRRNAREHGKTHITYTQKQMPTNGKNKGKLPTLQQVVHQHHSTNNTPKSKNNQNDMTTRNMPNTGT